MPDTDDPWGNGGPSELHAASPPIFIVDAHPVFQRGLNIEALPAAGIGGLAVKVQQGRDTSYVQAGSGDWVRRAKAIGLPVLGYIYLTPGDEDGQAAVFAEVLRSLGIPGMVDAEALRGTALAAADGHMPDLGGLGQHPHPRGVIRTPWVRVAGAIPAPALTMAGIRLFLDRCKVHGADVRLSYVPRWYWERMGSPSLAGLPPLWASSYPSTRAGTPQDLYQAVTPDRWAGYGGLNVAILQFAETGIVAGKQPVDLDAYLGTRGELAALLGIQPTPRTSEDAMAIVTLPRTPAPADLTDAPSTWPTTEEIVHLGWVQGWHGRVILRLAVGHPGGYLYRAHVDYPGAPTKVVPWIDPKVGQSMALDPPYRQGAEYVFEASAGSGTLMITYAAPGGASLNIEYEH